MMKRDRMMLYAFRQHKDIHDLLERKAKKHKIKNVFENWWMQDDGKENRFVLYIGKPNDSIKAGYITPNKVIEV